MNQRHANENIQARNHIAYSANKRRSDFENVEHLKKSAKTSSKNDDSRRSDDNVKIANFAVKRENVDEFYIVTRMHNIITS
jgi:hypothetical protein